MTLVLDEKNLEWTRCEESVNIEDSYKRSVTTGSNTTSCRMAMGSICAQIRTGIKRLHRDKKTAAGQRKKNASLDGTEYRDTVKEVFAQFDVDGNKVLDKQELLTGLFSLGVRVAEAETDLLMQMFATKRGFTYEQFSQMIVSGDTTRRKKSCILPALQRDEVILKMNKVSKNKRKERIKAKSNAIELYKPIRT